MIITRFTNLRTRLTVLYMGLFGIALMLVAIAVFTAINSSARTLVRDELSATGAVYGQIWASQSAQLHQGARTTAPGGRRPGAGLRLPRRHRDQ